MYLVFKMNEIVTQSLIKIYWDWFEVVSRQCAKNGCWIFQLLHTFQFHSIGWLSWAQTFTYTCIQSNDRLFRVDFAFFHSSNINLNLLWTGNSFVKLNTGTHTRNGAFCSFYRNVSHRKAIQPAALLPWMHFNFVLVYLNSNILINYIFNFIWLSLFDRFVWKAYRQWQIMIRASFAHEQQKNLRVSFLNFSLLRNKLWFIRNSTILATNNNNKWTNGAHFRTYWITGLLLAFKEWTESEQIKSTKQM